MSRTRRKSVELFGRGSSRAILIPSQEPPPLGRLPSLDQVQRRLGLWISQQRASWRGRKSCLGLFTGGSLFPSASASASRLTHAHAAPLSLVRREIGRELSSRELAVAILDDGRGPALPRLPHARRHPHGRLSRLAPARGTGPAPDLVVHKRGHRDLRGPARACYLERRVSSGARHNGGSK